MEDPFPAAPAWVRTATAPLAEALHLHTLPLHIHEVLGAALFYGAVQRLTPRLSRRLSPSIYPNLPAHTRLSWDVHTVSMVQSLLINGLALGLMASAREPRASMNATERVWAYTGGGGLIQALAAGYFLYDLLVTIPNVNVFGIGMLAHAVCALSVYMLGFRPFVNFYAPNFILYELSSPFLNIHWFLDKVNMTGSRLQWYNGMILLATFFGCRLVWGTYASVRVFRDIFQASRLAALPAPAGRGGVTETFIKNPASISDAITAAQKGDALSFARLEGLGAAVPTWIVTAYVLANITLNLLNWFWFSRMIETVRKRFREPRAKPKAKAKPTPEQIDKVRQDARSRARSGSDAVAAFIASGFDDLADNVDHVRRRVVEGEMGPPDAEDEFDMQ